MNNNVLIIVFQEGASGFDHISRLNSEYTASAMAGDVNAAAKGAFDAGAGAVYVFDPHDSPYALHSAVFKKNLDGAVKFVGGRELGELLAAGEISRAMLVGAHAMPGTQGAFLDGAHNPVAWHDYKLNGVSYGETGIAAVYLGQFDVPVVMVAGDGAGCREATALCGDITSAVVKTAKYRNRTESCLSADEARGLIYNAAAAAMEATPPAPYKAALPLEIEITFNRTDFCDDCIFCNNFTLQRTGARRAVKVLNSVRYYADLIF